MIYPTRRAVGIAAGLALPVFLLGLLFPAHWYAGLLALCLLLALLLADTMAGTAIPAVSADLRAPGTVFVGDDVTINLFARFDGSTPARIEAAMDWSAPLESRTATHAALTSHSDAATGTLRYHAARRGTARLEQYWLRWQGPLGLVWKQRTLKPERSVAILPDIRAVREEAITLFSRNAPQAGRPQLELGAGGEFQSLSEFRPGMDRRTIDWKHSARHASLLAKEFRTERNNPIVFAIDCGRLMCEPVAGLPRIDRAISAALLSAFVALRMGDRVSLFAYDSRPRIASGSVSGAQNFPLLQRLAAGLDYSTEESNHVLALTTLNAQVHRRSLMVVFTDFVDTTSAELMLRTVRPLTEKHLLLFVMLRDAELEDIAAATPTDSREVARAVTAAALLRDRKLVIGQLRQMGVRVIEAAHDQIGPALLDQYIQMKRLDLL